jgi:hypothetical protein
MIAVIVDAKDESARHFYERELSVVSRPTQEGCFGPFWTPPHCSNKRSKIAQLKRGQRQHMSANTRLVRGVCDAEKH